MRYVVIGYSCKGGAKEFTSVKGYILDATESMPCHEKIRRDCLGWANRDGDDFVFFQINFITFLEKRDYNSFIGV